MFVSQETINTRLQKSFKQLNYDIGHAKDTVDCLDKNFKELGIRFKYEYHPYGIDSDTDIYIFGYFYKDSLDQIEIHLSYNQDRSVEYDDEVVFQISSCIQHELVHVEQYMKRDIQKDNSTIKSVDFKAINDPKQLREYLSQTDEIDAYAHTAILELTRQTNDPRHYKSTDIWQMYQEAQVNDKVKRRFIRKLFKWFNKGISWQINTL